MKKVPEKQFYYHITDKDFGEVILLKPRHTNDDTPHRPPYNEAPDVARICVSPTIAHCLAALPLYILKDYKVYRTKRKIQAYFPIDVCDSRFTREKWILIPTTFVFRISLPNSFIRNLRRVSECFCGPYTEKGDITIIKKMLKKYHIKPTR